MNTFINVKKMRRNKNIFLVLLFSAICSISFTQNEVDSTKQNKVELIKIAYITKELNLTVAESEKFWPLYNELEAKLKENQKSKRKIAKDLKVNLTTLPDEEIKKKVNAIFEYETVQASIKKEYFNKFSLIIGVQKSAKLLNIEQQFKRELLKRLNQQKNKDGQNNRKGQPKKEQ